ncbi:MAG: hypothetical protein IJ111_01175 [Eggerthellaceae bacterium]|nr:hypothetical protein [Eggerthellaceae bacterium]
MTDECKCCDGTMHLATATVVVTDYELLDNKPSINGVELSGDKSLDDIGVETDAVAYRGSVESMDDLPESGKVGETYHVDSNGGEAMWDGNKWEQLGPDSSEDVEVATDDEVRAMLGK